MRPPAPRGPGVGLASERRRTMNEKIDNATDTLTKLRDEHPDRAARRLGLTDDEGGER